MLIASHRRHIIVADLDNLFEYVGLQQVFENEGYTIITCKTELSVRLVFELQVRDADKKYLLIAPANYKPLPDIEMEAHCQAIGLPQLFPNLDAKAIKGLPFNTLCQLSNIPKPYEELGYDKTRKFLLENLYNVSYDTLTSSKAKERVLNALVTVLLDEDGINESLTKYLAEIAQPHYPELVAKKLNKDNLIEFIQAQWQSYIDKGTALLDFNEPLLNKIVGYLFAINYLKPVQVPLAKYEGFTRYLKIGMYVNGEGNDHELEGLIEYLQQQLEIIENNVDQWFRIMQVLANAKLKMLLSTKQELHAVYQRIEDSFNIRFQLFIENTYGSQFSLSGVRKPVVVSRLLEHLHAKPAKKRALLVIDGMNYWQWVLLSKALTKAGINYSSNATLAFIPTITAWSRQAIFKGDKPDLSMDNSKEANMFAAWWENRGVPAYQINFVSFGVNKPFAEEIISADTTILGLVCNDLDKIMHGTVLGDNQLKTSTEQWIEQSNIVQIISALKQKGFHLYITADHGNVEGIGLKKLSMNGTVSISRGKRHLHFSNETMLESFLQQNANLEVGKKGFSVYLKKQGAFTIENYKVITHGGSHLWEVIVPFISINE